MSLPHPTGLSLEDVCATPALLRRSLELPAPHARRALRVVLVAAGERASAATTAALAVPDRSVVAVVGPGSAPIDDGTGTLVVDVEPGHFGDMTGRLIRTMGAAGVVDDPATVITEAADVGTTLLGTTDEPGVGRELGVDLADALRMRTPVVVGASSAAAVAAVRWITLLNAATGTAGLAVDDEGAELGAVAGIMPGPPGVIVLADPGPASGSEPGSPIDGLSANFDRIARPLPIIGKVFASGAGRVARSVSLGIVGAVAAATLTEVGTDQPTHRTAPPRPSGREPVSGGTPVRRSAHIDAIDTLRDFARSLRED